jgi:diguanylate cyclase
MRYTESKEQSAALLRLVVAQMGQHDAAFNPVTFAVWYEHVAGINPALSEGLKAALDGNRKLDTDTAYRLYRAHVAEPDAAEAERIGGDFQRVMRTIVEASSRTDETARAYSEKLNGLEQALVTDEPQGALGRNLTSTLQGTRDMQESVQSLRQVVAHGEQEIEQLRNELHRTRIELLTDPLTGVLNRKGFDQALARLLALPPAPGMLHCLVMLDIDHFKRINDTHGHLTGDTVLSTLGAVLQRVTRSAGVECARYGGEEFAVLLNGTTMAGALSMADSICALARTMKVRNRRTGEVIASVTMSAGIAAWQHGEDGTSLIAAADKALYRSKEAGRNRITVA